MRRKTILWILQATNEWDYTREDLEMVKKKKGNLKRETEYLLIATIYNAIRTDYTKAKIEKKQNSKCKLC